MLDRPQQLAYALWEATTVGAAAGEAELTHAVEAVLRSENSYFTRIWAEARKQERLLLQALAREPGRVFAADYRNRHKLSAASTVQYAVASLADDELIGRDPHGGYRIVEPFLAQWLERHVP